MSKEQIDTTLRAYSRGEMHLNNAIKLLGGGMTIERIIRQWMDGKLSYLEALSQIEEHINHNP